MKYIVANWKMNLTVRESVALARGVLREIRGWQHVPQIVLCPAATALHEVYKSLARSRVALGAQNAGPQVRSGAFTGEISPAMLEDLKVSHVLLGHSERRHLGETDVTIRQKLQATLQTRVTPILCVGESHDDHERGNSVVAIEDQLNAAYHHLEMNADHPIFIAYEPVWAIGTGDTPSVGDIVEMHTFIRNTVAALTSRSISDIRVLYGGSVNDENAYQLLREGEIDGVLVGGASLKLHVFKEILQAGSDVLAAQAE